jgi:peptide-methionine (S)-S-oxide reductase
MCGKYRSAIYAYDDEQCKQAADIVDALRADFDEAVITQV